MAIQLNSIEQGFAKTSVACDFNKTKAIMSLLLSLLDRIGVEEMRGRKTTTNGVGVNGDVVKAVAKARKSYMAKGHTESYGSVHTCVSGIWTNGIAPFIKEKADTVDIDWDGLAAEAKLWATGEKSLWKLRKKSKKQTRSTLSAVETFEKWFTDMTPANQQRWLSSARGKKFVKMLK